MAEGLPIERLREFLRELKPAARTLLATELERAMLRGEDPPGASFILDELRSEARNSGRKMPRVGNAQRLFFAPLEPFLAAMGSLLDRGLRQFKFVDRTFNLNLNISKAILQFFLERYRVAYANEMAHFIDAVAGGKPVRTTIADGVKALELADAATRSWRERRIVEL